MRLCDAVNRCVTLLQIVILKELKHSDGNFNETQKIELNAVSSVVCVCVTCEFGWRSDVTDLFCECASRLCSSSISTTTT